jgi:long-chain acyl-CoA synthetase
LGQNNLALANGESLAAKYPAGTRWDIDIPSRDLASLIDESIIKYADRPAMDFLGKTLTYHEFGQLVTKAAKGLEDMGVTKGSKVGLYMPNTPYYPIMFLATLRLGATVVNFSPLYTTEELRAQIKDSGTSVMVALDLKEMQDKAVQLLCEGTLKNVVRCPMGLMLPFIKSAAFQLFKSKDIAAYVNDKRIIPFGKLVANDGNYRSVVIDPQGTAVLQYTGGTTGVPKGAMLTHFNLVANCHQIQAFFGASPEKPDAPGLIRPGQERFLAAIPYFHVFGMMTAMLFSMKMGGHHILMPNPRDLKQLQQAIDKKKPTFFPAVPRLLQALSEHPKADKYNFSSLLAVISGGAALPPAVKGAFETATKQKDVIKQGYGLTETSPAVTSNPAYGPNKPDSVGLAYPRTEIKITHPDNTEQTMKIGEIGEILIRGPQVMKGYYNKPDATAEVMTKDGWLLTGDLGYLDEDMYLHIVDRKKRMIIVNGYKVYPNQVEKAISEHPAVAECVVIGIKDERSGEAGKAFIRFKQGHSPVSEAELRAFLDSKINRIEMPKTMEFVTEELPKTAVGKPDWKKLQDQERAKAVSAPTPKP